MKRFEGKAVLVTGGAGSIGWATAQRFSAEGARVVLADLNGERAAELSATLDGIGVGADVAEEAGARAAVEAVLETMRQSATGNRRYQPTADCRLPAYLFAIGTNGRCVGPV